jgi:serine/threonine-protein kinase RsbT
MRQNKTVRSAQVHHGYERMTTLGQLQPDIVVDAEHRLAVTAEHHVTSAQRLARRTAEALGFDRIACYHIATAITELASNLLRHAGSGEVQVREIHDQARHGIEIRTLDQGPGIADLALALREGFSTAGGLGGGLPGVERLMDELWLSSTPQTGTQVVARKWLSDRTTSRRSI